jgi:hypothetical protein
MILDRKEKEVYIGSVKGGLNDSRSCHRIRENMQTSIKSIEPGNPNPRRCKRQMSADKTFTIPTNSLG